jgi:hypothetical protein
MKTVRGSELGWHQSLEQWCAENFGHRRQSVQEQAYFAPFEAHKPEKFHEVAVALVVLTSATRSLHRGFVEALELVRASTSAFRAVLVTDLYQSPALEVSDYPVEQLLAEETWSSHQDSNWLEHAAAHVVSAQGSYGASYLVAPAGPESAAAALRHLAYLHNAPTPVLAQALEILAENLHDEAAGPLGFRHGWEVLTAGAPQRRVFVSAQGHEVSAQIFPGSGRGVVVDPSGALPQELLRAAQNTGWSTAVLSATGQGTSAASRFATNVQRACADALNGGGPVLVYSEGGDSGRVPVDGRLRPPDSDDRWSVELDSIATLLFAPDQASRVFDRLQSLNSSLLSR